MALKKPLKFCVAALLSGFTIQARAAAISQFVYAYDPSYNAVSLDRDHPLTSFNPTLGDLNSVTLALSVTLFVTFEQFNADSPVQGAVVFPAAGVAGAGMSFETLANIPASSSSSGSGPFNISEFGSIHFDFVANLSAAEFYLAGGPDLTVSAGVDPPLQLPYYAGSTEVTQSIGVQGMLIYNYTPSAVPEPASFALFGAGLLGAAAGRRYWRVL